MAFLFLFLSSLFAQPTPEVDIEKYFKNLSSQERSAYMAASQVMNDSWSASEIQSMDVLDNLSKTCNMEYKRDVNGRPILPTVECEYQPKAYQNGMTSKFRCNFQVKNKVKALKVKYSFKEPTDTKEIPQAVISASMARMMGFYANTYCPAIVVCKGCSQDPWDLQNRSASPAVNQTTTFKNAVVEVKVKGNEITVPTPVADGRPLGWKWEELKTTLKSATKEEKKALAIQRQAYMLYVNFIYHTDADPHNNKVVCAEWTLSGRKPVCQKVVAYTSDFGDSFKKMDYGTYKGYTPLSSSCVGGLSRPSGISRPKISEEAKDLFVDHFDRMSDAQLTDIFELAQVRKFHGNPSDWISVLRRKVDDMKSRRCAAYSMGDRRSSR